MKKLLIMVFFVACMACSKDSNDEGGNNNPPTNGGGNGDCGTYLGYALYKDNEGCYYNGANYSKVYVDAGNCTCN